MTNPPVEPVAPESWAEVRAHDQVMRYRRSGSGPAVLLLAHRREAPPLWPPLAEALAARFRVIVPELPAGDGQLAARLGGFLEGLGVARVAVVAAGRLCATAIELALATAEQVSRLVLVPGAPGDAAGCDAVALPLLVLEPGTPVEEALPLVAGLLAEGRAEERA